MTVTRKSGKINIYEKSMIVRNGNRQSNRYKNRKITSWGA